MKNELYELGCQARDGFPSDIKTALQHFLDSKSFEGTYAIAELYQHGRSVSVFALEAFEIKLDQAIAFYLKAYAFHKNQFIFEEDGENLHTYSAPIQTITEANELLKQASELNPDALFQLASFYINEAQALPTERIISASPQELSERIRGCLIAAANLYHPHAAACLLTTDYGNKLSPQEKLKYSRIAADPALEMSSPPDAHASQVSFRGDEPVTTTLRLPRGIGLPPELRKQHRIVNTSLKSIFKQNEHTLGEPILPREDKPYDRTSVNILGGANESLSKEPLSIRELRELRAAHFGSRSSSTTSHEPTNNPSLVEIKKQTLLSSHPNDEESCKSDDNTLESKSDNYRGFGV